jgi:hypothetical protein
MKLRNNLLAGAMLLAATGASAQVYVCEPCPAGTYSNGSSTTCTPCPAGKYQPDKGSASCLLCPANSSSSAGATGCACNEHYSLVGSSWVRCNTAIQQRNISGFTVVFNCFWSGSSCALGYCTFGGSSGSLAISPGTGCASNSWLSYIQSDAAAICVAGG